ncbi:TrbG/VirB9 family P-type conjugative transfer protein [Achromobacter xylosoxidans]|uniref:TrbG/VirB9 family P-type conjugative transfer protein n=1 Tax=Alcaligenes xylosoxydans xylosoxydans TaxID=85698 RepID=UPI002E18C163|nr:TrbG/VirB9 family P-type conjugative transfer protein [Achromobacter xylosoxidans]
MVRILFLAGALSSLAGCAWTPGAAPVAGAGWRASGVAAPGFRFDWLLSGDPAVAPMQVFDDGRETWLQFAPGQAIPAIFGVDADGERVVPYVRRDPYVVLAGNWDSLWFRGGRLLARARRAPAGGLDQGAADGDASAGMSPRVQGADNPL